MGVLVSGSSKIDNKACGLNCSMGGGGLSGKGVKVSLSEHILELLIEGKVRVARGRRLKLGKYRIVGRYARVQRLGCEGEGAGNQ